MFKFIPSPFDVGFEAIGEIVKVGKEVPSMYKIGSFVGIMSTGCFATFKVVHSSFLFLLPCPDPIFLCFLVNGFTAYLALEKANIQSSDLVLITAAAGATGQMAVQIAKTIFKAKEVIGTCSNSEKSKHLARIGCDWVINYTCSNVVTEIKKKYPKGVNVVFESVGGKMLKECLQCVDVNARVLIIGAMGSYKE
jgi:NADPH-dependent curcumin reductase CurA